MRGIKPRGDEECGELQHASVCWYGVLGWKSSTFLPLLIRCCHIGWFAGIYQNTHLNFFSYI